MSATQSLVQQLLELLREQISFPDNLTVKRLAILGTFRPTPAPSASIPIELDRQRQQAHLPPLPLRWICESTEPLAGGLAYKCRADS